MFRKDQFGIVFNTIFAIMFAIILPIYIDSVNMLRMAGSIQIIPLLQTVSKDFVIGFGVSFTIGTYIDLKAMGDAFARDLLNYPSPRVSLLSIGEEEGKGNSQVKEAYELLKLAQNLNFIGNAEGRDIFTGDVDVVVCDGFVGNVVVKMSEGLASSLIRMLKRVFTSGVLPALGGMLAKGAFKKFAATIDYAEYGGAPLLGLQGLAIVCHGRSNSRAMMNAIKMSGNFVRKGTNDRLAETILANEELTRFSRAI